MDRPFPAYQGDDPYIFVSYAHEDSDQVFPAIQWLRDQGFNIWYDEGIAPGASWREELAESILRCDLFIVFVSPRSANSANCLKEVNYALEQGRPVLAVHIEPTQLSPGLTLALSDRQAIFRHELTEEEYRDKVLTGVKGHVRQQPTPIVPAPVAQVPATSSPAKPIVIGFGLLSLAVLVVGLLLYYRPAQEPAVTSDVVAAPVAETASQLREAMPSIAVLPFDNLSPLEENAYFASGMHEDVLHNIAKIPNIQVIARNSVMLFQGVSRRPREIGQELGASHLVTGSVRRAGDQVRITVRLVDAPTEKQLWSEVYDRRLEDIFAIQSDVARRIADSLQVTLDVPSANRIGSKPTDNLAAYDLFVKGREIARIGTRESSEQAVSLFEQAISLSPDFALAHAHIALQLTSMPNWKLNRQRSQEEAELALSLDDGIAQSNFAMARVLTRDRKSAAAFPYFEQAILLDPNNAEIRGFYGGAYLVNGDFVNAQAQWKKSLHLDPLHVDTVSQIASVLELQGKFEEATAYFLRAAEMEPGSVDGRAALMSHYSRRGLHFNALETALDIHREHPSYSPAVNMIASTLTNLREFDASRSWIEKMPVDLVDARLRLATRLLEVEEKYETEIEMSRNWYESDTGNRIAQRRYAFALLHNAAEQYGEEKIEESIRMRELGREILRSHLEEDRVDGEYNWRLDNQHAISVLMVLSKSLGDDAEAEGIAHGIIDMHETQIPLRQYGSGFHAGLAYLMLGDKQMAIEMFQEGAEALNVTAVDLPGQYGVTEDVYGIYLGLARDIAYRDAINKMEQRNATLLARIRGELPELIDGESFLQRP